MEENAKLSKKLHGANRVNVPTKLDEETWRLRDDVVTFARNNCYFLCEVPSLISDKEPIPREENGISPFEEKCPYEVENYNIKEIQDICNIICVKADEFLNEGHTLNQTQPTEICIFMLSNSNRIFQRDHPKEAFQAVCKKKPDILSHSIVYDHVDPQNAAFAEKVFSKPVEIIKKEGFHESANFVCWVCKWHFSL